MGGVISGILTDADMRKASVVEKALLSKAEKAAPWFGSAAE